MSRVTFALGLMFAVLALWGVLGWEPVQRDRSITSVPAELEAAQPTAAGPTLTAHPARPRVAAPSPPGGDSPPAVAVPVEEPAEPVEAPQLELPDPAMGTRATDELIRGDQGPVTEYRETFQSESRANDAGATELLLRENFTQLSNADGLLRSVSCRQTICKLDLRWSMKRMHPYLDGIMRSQNFIEQIVAVSPVGPADGFGVRPVELYLKRKPAPQP